MTDATYPTWNTDPQVEAAMADVHAPLWRHLIEMVPERDLTNKTILDFGCNRGGFLRLLYSLRPFRQGVGIDIAEASVAAANDAKGNIPAVFEVTTDLTRWRNTIDIAFSSEVIYLVPNLKGHARDMHDALRKDGVYYAVTGCHTGWPLWPAWREAIAASSNAPVQDYSPEDFVDAFAAAGFDVSARPFNFKDFINMALDKTYYPTVIDQLSWVDTYKLIFRFTKK